VATLGGTLLEVVEPGSAAEADVGGVSLLDPGGGPPPGPGDLVLGVSVDGDAGVVAAIEQLAELGCCALLVKTPALDSGVARQASRRTGVALVSVAPEASWLHLADLLKSVLAGSEGLGDRPTVGGVGAGDLFTLAEAISALVDGPVTIEDRSSQVLAFSSGQDEADRGRIETVLGRRVPQPYLDELGRRGVFKALAQGDEPVFVEGMTNDIRPRVAVAVRAGGELLGSVWAAVPEPLTPERNRALMDAAQLVALHMLRQRVGSDVGQRLQADLIASVIEGGARAPAAAARLRMDVGSARVLAAQVRVARDDDAAGDAGDESTMQRLRDTLAFHFGALHPRSATALLGGAVYTVLPGRRDEDDGQRTVSLARNVLERIGERDDVVIAVGGLAPSYRDIPRSRREADRVLRVLQQAGSGGARVARLADVQLDSLLLHVSDAVLADHALDPGPIAVLRAYDAEHQSQLVETLRAYLDAMGNVKTAAQVLRLHPNTMRYRLQRLCEISGVDLDDPDTRLATALLLRMGG
jgi:hypothetical protein